MSTMINATQNELRKIFWRPKYWILLIVYALIGLGAGMIGALGNNLGTIAGFLLSERGPDALYISLTVYRSLLIPLAIFMLSADVFTHELESKSIKCALIRPVSRFDIYLSKCLAIFLYCAIALGVGFVVVATKQVVSSILAPSLISSAINTITSPSIGGIGGGGIGSSIRSPSALSTAAMIGEAFVSYMLTLAPITAYVAFAAFFAVLIHSPALVMFLCIVSYIALSFFSTFNTSAGAAIFTTYSGWYRMWLGYQLPWRSLLTTAGVLLSTCVAFFGFGYFIFDKKDI